MNMPVRQARTAAEDAIAAALETQLAAGPAEGRIGEIRRAALDAFRLHGLPHRRVEEWKYTDLRAALRDFAPLAGMPDAAAVDAASRDAVAVPEAARALFVSGRLASIDPSLPPGVTVRPLADAIADGDPLAARIGTLGPDRHDGALALNTGFLGEGVVVRVAAGTKQERPLHFAHIFPAPDAVSGFTRCVVVVEDGAEVTLVESFAGAAGVAYQANHVLELSAGDGATVNLVRIQEESEAALHLATLAYELGRDAHLNVFTLTQGARLSRHSVFGRFGGQGSKVDISGATLLKDRQHADATLLVDHAVPHCESRELFKTVLADAAHGVFQGKIVVRRDAQKTDGRMMSQSLLLSDAAQMDNKPELEIFADDVQCGHGATVGALDEDMLFYLRSRGLSTEAAEMLLIQAFLGEAVEHVENDDLRDLLIGRMVSWLETRAG